MSETVTHTDVAEAIARETGWDLEEHAEEREWSAVGVGPVGQHRDSDPLERSNFEVIHRDLAERFGDSVDVASFRHWAVGWIEEITYDAGRPELVAAVDEWRAALADYPCADEEHYSQLEWDDNHPDCDELCYSDDPDCSCGRRKA